MLADHRWKRQKEAMDIRSETRPPRMILRRTAVT
jgi:hypothetical protein